MTDYQGETMCDKLERMTTEARAGHGAALYRNGRALLEARKERYQRRLLALDSITEPRNRSAERVWLDAESYEIGQAERALGRIAAHAGAAR